MPRGPRLDAPGLLQHVIARGIERSKIFLDDTDYNSFLQRLGKVVENTNAQCLTWCLLPNHFHLLLRTGDEPLSFFMRRLLTGYAITFNLRHKRSGHLFQNRYKSIICQEDKYLLELIRYINIQPLKASLVKNLSDLNNYPYSGHQILIGKSALPWQKSEEVLSLFGKTKTLAKRNYLKFISDGISGPSDLDGRGFLRSTTISDQRKVLEEKEVFDERILGEPEFVQRLLQIESLKDKIEPRVKITPRELIEKVTGFFKIHPLDLKGSKKTMVSSNARAIISFLAVNYLELKGADIAKELKVTKACISKLIPKGREILERQPELKDKILE